MHLTKFKYGNKQRAIPQQERQIVAKYARLTPSYNHPRNFIAITQKISKQELQFMCTALPLDEIYPPTKFRNYSKYSFRDMHQTKL